MRVFIVVILGNVRIVPAHRSLLRHLLLPRPDQSLVLLLLFTHRHPDDQTGPSRAEQ